MRSINMTFLKITAVGLLALLATLPFIYAQHPQQQSQQQPQRAEPGSRGEPAARGIPAHAQTDHSPAVVDRSNHGTIRHVDTHAAERPVDVRRDFDVNQHVIVHHDVDVDIHRQQFWHGFAYGTHHHGLRPGYVQLFVGGSPYYYDDGIYYQQAGSEYQEVYPPIGANIVGLPDGAIEIVVGNIVYYYAGGAFYVQQGGGFAIVMPPVGVTVPELPPGAMRVSLNGGVAYQFNGVHYRPAFVNGVTCYMTFTL